MDSSNGVLVADPWNQRIRLVFNAQVTTYAGDGVADFADGSTNSARFNCPIDVAVDKTGNVYIADPQNYKVRLLSNGNVSTLAGDGTKGYADGPAVSAKFQYPNRLAVDGAGKVYVSDYHDHRIRVIYSGQVTTLAGTGTAGYVDGPAASAQFWNPGGIAVDGAGRVYVADMYNQRIRVVENGAVSTLAGTGTPGFSDGSAASALFNYPDGLVVDSSGALFVADANNHRVRCVFKGNVSTLAGSGQMGFLDGPATSAQFYYPHSLALGAGGEIYVADPNSCRIRKIVAGNVSTVTGNGVPAFADGSLSDAMFYKPYGVAAGASGHVFVADTFNHRIRKISSTKVTTIAGDGVLGSSDGPATSARFNIPY